MESSFLRLFALWVFMASAGVGAEIEWGEPQAITGQLVDFDTVGSPVLQWNGGAEEVEVAGLVFTAGPRLSRGRRIRMDPLVRNGDAGYEELLDTLTWTTRTESVYFRNLRVGHVYRVQIWIANTQSGYEHRIKRYDSGPTTDQVTLKNGGPSQYVIGTFVADSTVQTLRMLGSGSYPMYSAIALRTEGLLRPRVKVFQADGGGVISERGVNIAEGEAVDLSWNVEGADVVSLNQGIGAVSAVGGVTVQPAVTTTYTMTATNEGGDTVNTITIFVGANVEPVRLNEIVAKNDQGLKDEDGERRDWIEIFNPNPFAVDMGGYGLSDDASLAEVWSVPAGRVIEREGFLVVFASGKDRGGDELHVAFQLSSDGEFLGLVDDEGGVVDSYSPGFPALDGDRSYGVDGSGAMRYFAKPSPGEVNGDGVDGFVADPEFSEERGFRGASFDLELASETAGAVIRYTLDGSVPVDGESMVYAGPIPISSTTVVRAAAFRAGFARSRVVTHSFLFADDVIDSDVMDPAITGDALYADSMDESLKALPIISLNFEDPETIDGETERLTSVEMIFADGSEGFQVDAGVKSFGGYFSQFDKKSYRLKFRSEYGAGKLEFPLFEGFENGFRVVDEFDALDLRSGSHEMVERGAYMGNRFADDTMLEMGNLNPHGRFVHVFINGTYWGQYHLRERWSAAMAEEYYGGEREDYEAIGGSYNGAGWAPGLAYDGDGSGWEEIKMLARTSTPWESLLPRVDMQNYLDYMILYKWGGCENEYRAILEEDGGMGLKLYLNDADGLFHPTGLSQNNDYGGPGNLLGRLKWERHPDFKAYVADRIYEHYFNDGALTVGKTVERLQRRMDEIEVAFYCEAARWGYRTPASWRAYQDNLLNNQLLTQRDLRLQELRNEGLYPGVEAPSFGQHGGLVESGFGLEMASEDGGVIWFTDDGSDPRLAGGGVNPAAQMMPGSAAGALALTLTADVLVQARVLKDGEWSAVHRAEFVVSVDPQVPVAGDLVISELHYHPADPTAEELAMDEDLDDDDFEFVELMNVAGYPLILDGVRFVDGVEFVFGENEILEVGQRLVLARNRVAFGMRSSVTVAGEYSGKFKNSGERVVVEGAVGEVLIDFVYEDGGDAGEENWPSEADGDGGSLVLIDPRGGGSLGDPFLWRVGFGDHGSPGGSDAATLPMAPGGDVDGDGFSNLLETVMMSGGAGEVPRVEMTVENIGGEDFLVVSFRRDARYEASLRVEVAGADLIWRRGGVLLGREVHGDGTETWRYRYPDRLGSGGQFMRVRAE